MYLPTKAGRSASSSSKPCYPNYTEKRTYSRFQNSMKNVLHTIITIEKKMIIPLRDCSSPSDITSWATRALKAMYQSYFV
jgi:hypothetical protein